MNELHLFAGAGGGILGGLLLGHTPVCAVEIDGYNRTILQQRQNDGMLPKFEIWDDVKTFNGDRWRGSVDVICGGFPCQDISCAGKKVGIDGTKSSLWKEYLRIIKQIAPKYVFAENSAAIIGRGLDVVLQDLSEAGYDAEWGVFSASDLGFPHKRARCFILAYPMQSGNEGNGWGGWVERWERCNKSVGENGWADRGTGYVLRNSESELERVTPDGVACGVDRHYAIGNGQVPAVAAAAFRILAGKDF